MKLWQRLFSAGNTATPKPTAGTAASQSQELPAQGERTSLREKDVEVLLEAALNAVSFIRRHKLTGIYAGSDGPDMYASRVVHAFQVAEQRILPEAHVKAIATSCLRHTIKSPPVMWSDREMCSVLLPLLDLAMAHIGATPEVMPLVQLKVDIQKVGGK